MGQDEGTLPPEVRSSILYRSKRDVEHEMELEARARDWKRHHPHERMTRDVQMEIFMQVLYEKQRRDVEQMREEEEEEEEEKEEEEE
jgi:hypothetical protein